MTGLKTIQSNQNIRMSDLQGILAAAQSALLKASKQLKSANAKTAATVKYLAQIKPGCDFIFDNIAQRRTARTT